MSRDANCGGVAVANAKGLWRSRPAMFPLAQKRIVGLYNHDLGSEVEIDSVTHFRTVEGRAGHAIYGPYEVYQPGDYAVEFILQATEAGAYQGDDICAVVDVACDYGRVTLAREEIPLARLGDGRVMTTLRCHLDEPQALEFRVAVTGRLSLTIEERRLVIPIPPGATNVAELLAGSRFPENVSSAFFEQNRHELRRLYEAGATIRVVDTEITIQMNEVWLHARVSDDLHFIMEVLRNNTYNFIISGECCVIDIGMNIGLAALFFAKKGYVKEVHSFEPFPGTFARGVANIQLNPDVAQKIKAKNFGIADWSGDTSIIVDEHGASGSATIRGVVQGPEVRIAVRRADTELGPILRSAKEKGLVVVAKIDCEGSEFPIFESLEQSSLLSEFAAIMLEWHPGVGAKTKHDLIAPLLANDFVVFDLPSVDGNGFFYAVRRTM